MRIEGREDTMGKHVGQREPDDTKINVSQGFWLANSQINLEDGADQ